jgi:hypothetical protein
VDLTAKHTYQQAGPFTRASVSVYGRTQLEAIEAARAAGQRLAEALPTSVTCRPAAYEGFNREVRKHAAVIVVSFGVSDDEVARREIDALVADL